MMIILYTLIILWTVSEATIFWLAPDIAIAIAYVYFPAYWRRFLLLGLLGALMGSVITYTWAAYDSSGWLAYVSQLRFHESQNIQYVQQVLQHDYFSIIKGAWGGIPFKLFMGIAAMQHKNPLAILPIGLLSRAIRFSFVLGVTAGIRYALKPWSHKHPGLMTVLLLTIWFSMIAIFDIWVNKAFLLAQV